MKMIDSAVNQHGILFRRMAQGGRWHLYRIPETDRVCLMRDDARWDIPVPPIMVADVQRISGRTLAARIQNIVASGAAA
jgi:hypothetical protein